MVTLLFFAFVSGLITILAPCIWPLLPIIFSASSGAGKKRPFGLSLGIVISFAILTLSIATIQKFLPIDPNIFRLTAVLIITALGVVMIFPGLSARLESLVSRLTGPLPGMKGTSEKSASGFASGFWTGASIGMVWAPCAGPILATIATLAATRALNADVLLVTLAYITGLAIPLFLFALTGSAFFGRLRRFNRYTGRIQQAFGMVMIVSAILIYTNYDKAIQARILDAFPGYSQFLSQFEDRPEVNDSLSLLRKNKYISATISSNTSNPLADDGPAPDFTGINHWLNTPKPLSMNDLKGKVVLVDFWTYSCINCIRTLPHVTSWYEKYKDAGFVVIGVHTPEFAFEKETANVKRALEQFGINYPVAEDNDYGTWQAYNNHYWPAHYLVDGQGHVRETHFGEGNYEKTEEAIRALLKESGRTLNAVVKTKPDETPTEPLTPETYLGLARMERFASQELPHQGEQSFTLPADLTQDDIAYGGHWTLNNESAHPERNAVLEIRFKAAQVFLVAAPGEDTRGIKVFLDSKPLPDDEAGTDVKHGILRLDSERLYRLVALKDAKDSHLLRLEFSHPGVTVYAFTFG